MINHRCVFLNSPLSKLYLKWSCSSVNILWPLFGQREIRNIIFNLYHTRAGFFLIFSSLFHRKTDFTHHEWVSESCSVMSDSLQPHGLYSLSNFSGQNIGVGSLSLLQGIVPIQSSNQVSHLAGGFFTSWATREALHTPYQGFKAPSFLSRFLNKILSKVLGIQPQFYLY